MTDLEKIELSLRRVAADSAGPFGFWFVRLADQIAKDEAERKAAPNARQRE